MNTVEDTPIVVTVVKWFGDLAGGGGGYWNPTVAVEESTI